MLAVSTHRLWLRQADDRGQSATHALSVSYKDKVLNDVISFRYEGTDRFAGRIDAEHARLEDGYWQIENAWLSAPNRTAEFVKNYRLKTDLTITQIQDSLASPQTLSFWELPEFTAQLQAAGSSGPRTRLPAPTLRAYPRLSSQQGP